MTDSTGEYSRKDDSMMRKTIYGLVTTIFLGGAGHFYTLGRLEDKVDNDRVKIKQLMDGYVGLSDALATHIEKSYEVRVAITDIRADTRSMSKTLDKLVSTVETSVNNQNQIIPIVNQAQDYMSNNRK